ncbi:MAG: hypothetical protein G3M78_04305 [Candidatus Nitrohelix vancouverensis]|uniref:FIST N domain protein n=1 Tax=Candidatus Nitrohelix vancouverensis TaxID=2705534 RepID=A0A7T0G2V0_9BACT|nr:MAG: hypothetical protein G3M78_04305 [Candidatus Nitrohelix vancouverensis]
MKWASAISTNEQLDPCIEETVASIKQQLGGAEPHLTILFVSSNYGTDLDAVREKVSKLMSPGILFGCTGGGIIGAGEEVEQKPAFSMTCAHLPDVNIKPIYSDTLNLPDQDTAPSVWREWLGVEAVENLHFIFLADPFSFRGEEFLAGFDFAYPNSKKVGGLASGARQPGGNRLFLDDKIYSKGMVGLALSGNIQLDTVVAQGCRPIGKPMNITECDQMLIRTLDGKPPLEILQEIYETLNEKDQELLQTSLFLGIEMNALNDNPQQGDFLIRNLMGADRESGGISVGAMLREGQLVQFHLRDKIMSAEDLNMVLTRYSEKNDLAEGSGALLFSCLGRGQYLYGEPNHDSNMFKEKLGAIPLGGFFCNGEIGPVGSSTFLHGYTSSFGIFKPASA